MKNNNKLIAEFLGMRPHHNDSNLFIFNTKNGNDVISLEELKFNTDWNWLMEVVEKIEKLKTPITNNLNLLGKFVDYEFHIQDKHIKIYAHGEVTKEVVDLRSSESDTKIEATYKAVVEFIKWYNEQ